MRRIVFFIAIMVMFFVSGFAQKKDLNSAGIKIEKIEKPKDDVNYLTYVSMVFAVVSAIASGISAFNAHRSASSAIKNIEFNQPIIYIKELSLCRDNLIYKLENKGRNIGFVREIELCIGGEMISYKCSDDRDMILSDGRKEITIKDNKTLSNLYNSASSSELIGSGFVDYESIVEGAYRYSFECIIESVNNDIIPLSLDAKINTIKIKARNKDYVKLLYLS